jgi:hypothetical protein
VTNKKYICKYIKISFFLAGFAGHWVIDKDQTVWLDEARILQKYVGKYIKIVRVAKLPINGM